MASTLQAMIGGKIAPFFGLRDEHMDIDTIITIYNTAVTDEASDKLGKKRRRKTPYVPRDVFDFCDEEIFKEEALLSKRSKIIQESKQEDCEGSEESKGVLDRCSVPGD